MSSMATPLILDVVVFRYIVAHSFGRPLVYPGSTGLLQSGYGIIIILKLVLTLQ